MMSTDQSKAVVLILLDLSTAFDTVYRDVLFPRLEKPFGLSDIVLHWFTSYLTERSQPVSIQGFHNVQFLVLHYSQCIQNDLVPLHSDTQLYVSLDPGNKADVSTSLEGLENCIADIRLQMTSNFF